MFTRLFLLLAGIAALLTGCGKPADAPATTPTSAVVEKTTPSNSAESSSAAAISETDMSAVLASLTQVLRKYSFERKQLPATVEEIVAAGYLSAMPPAPAGKKFAIDEKGGKVVLIKK